MFRFIIKLTLIFWYVMFIALVLEILKALFEISVTMFLVLLLVAMVTGYRTLNKAR